MPYNPCGRVVDFGRVPYRTSCRFFKDSDVETDIIWYPALPNAPVLGFPSAISSLNWGVEERDIGVYCGYRVGEVPTAERKYTNQKPKPAARGGHVCGTPEDFADGAVYDPDAPPIPYRPDGLPQCCVDGGGVGLGWQAFPLLRGELGWYRGDASPRQANSETYPGSGQGYDIGVEVIHCAQVVEVGSNDLDGFWRRHSLAGGTYTVTATEEPDPVFTRLLFWFVVTPGGGAYTSGAQVFPGFRPANDVDEDRTAGRESGSAQALRAYPKEKPTAKFHFHHSIANARRSGSRAERHRGDGVESRPNQTIDRIAE